jgi:hypothetical protein
LAAGRLRTAGDARLTLVALRVRRAAAVAEAALRRLDGAGGAGGMSGSEGAGAEQIRLPPLDGLEDGGLVLQVLRRWEEGASRGCAVWSVRY